MSAQSGLLTGRAQGTGWYQAVRGYEQPSVRQAIWQIVNSFIPYLLLWILMIRLVQSGASYWITLVLSVVAAGFLIRIFIVFHDCGHNSFFASRRANTILGYVAGVLTFTPYEAWRHSHAVHHSTMGNLDQRGTGDVWLMTVDEYRSAPRLKQIVYRVFQAPFIMFGIGSGMVFLFVNRLPQRGLRRQDRRSVHLTNLALGVIVLVAGLTIGLRTYVLIQLPIILIAAATGVWLFYVHHQYEGVHLYRDDEWTPLKAALNSSSYYKLPAVLQWFTGNIGFHHIHHVRPRIPNYNLPRAFRTVPELRTVAPLSIPTSLKSLFLHLYDERQHQLVSFRDLRLRRSGA